MQIMKKDLEDGYNKVLNEFENEKSRLQTRCEQLKQQLNETQQNIELLKRNHTNELNILREKHFVEQDNRNRQENLQNRLEHMMKLLEKENQTFVGLFLSDKIVKKNGTLSFFSLNEERTVNAQKEHQFQQTISSLQKKIADMMNQHTKVVDEIRREFNQERLNFQKQQIVKPISMPQFVQVRFPTKTRVQKTQRGCESCVLLSFVPSNIDVSLFQTDLSFNEDKIDYLATIEKLRGNHNAILKKSSSIVQVRRKETNGSSIDACFGVVA